MAYPLVLLAVASLLGGFFGIAQFITPQFSSTAVESPIFAPFEPFQAAPVAALLGLGAIGVGFAAAYILYAGAESDPLPRKMNAVCHVLRHKFYFDEFYGGVVAICHDTPARVINLVDICIQLVVRLTHGTVEWTGRVLRLAQTGNLQTYSLLLAAGAALALYLMLMR